MGMVELLHELGHVLMGGVFLWVGIGHFLKFGAVTSQLKESGFPAPGPMLAAGSTLEIVAGFCLAIGLARTYAALALLAFTVAASMLALNFWRYDGATRQTMKSGFLINIAVAGGLMLAAT
jgi:putative oxidoreductase